MRITTGIRLLPLNLLLIVSIVVITLIPSTIMRMILGLPFVLFLPGYASMVALYPRKIGITGIERVALSFGLSITIVSLIGLIMNYSQWGIRLESMLYTIASIMLITSIITWFRQRRLSKVERFDIKFRLALPSWGSNARDKALSIILVLTIVGALGVMGYVLAAPKVGERFTEFYVLNQEGAVADYPEALRINEQAELIVGIINNEYGVVSYQIEVRLNGVRNSQIGPITLGHGDKWEETIVITPSNVGTKQKVEFFLYRDGELKQYLKPLRLWIDVIE